MGHYAAAIKADLEEVFNATWRKGLICKLYKAGDKVTLQTILDSFLTNRYSWNLVNGYISEWFESDFGLPQRSILIPVPFVVFSGDISADRVKSTYNFQTDPLNIHQINPNMLTTTHG